jgi:hypothetical protein
MKSIVATGVVLILVGALHPVSAQTRGAAYAVGAVGSWSGLSSGALFGGAAGAEAVVNDLVGIGAEAGLLTSSQGGLLVSISPGASLRIPKPSRIVPFVSGGYSYMQFFEGSDHAYHFGGGIEIGRNARRRLRLEFRDLVRPSRFTTSHYWTIRIGIAGR